MGPTIRRTVKYVYLIWVENDGTILPGGRDRRLFCGDRAYVYSTEKQVQAMVAALQASSDEVKGRLLYTYSKNEVYK